MTQPDSRTDAGNETLRMWVDGPPTESMLSAREEHISRLDPKSIGRWSDSDAGRRELARAAWESGWDSACFREAQP